MTFESDVKDKKDVVSKIDKFPFLILNLLMIFHTIDNDLQVPLINQFLYQSFANDVLGNATLGVNTISNPCLQGSSRDGISSTTHQKDRVQELTTRKLFHLEATHSIINVFSVILLGSLSTRLSRRVQILIPKVGFTLRSLCICIVISFRLDVNWLFVGSILEGLSGGKVGIFLGTILYTTDITPRDTKRTLGMSILEGSRGIIGAFMALLAGVLIQRVGFLFTACAAVSSSFMSIVCIFLLPDRQHFKAKKTKMSLNDSIRIFLNSDETLRHIIIIGSIVYFLTFCTGFGVEQIRIIYLMNSPICWDAISIGWYQLSRCLIFNISSIVSISLLYRYLPGVNIAVLGTLFNMMEFLTYASVSHGSQLWLALVFALGKTLPINIVRGETSRLLGPELQGALFFIFAFQESTSFAVGTLSLSIYNSTVSFFPGIIFYIFFTINVIVASLLVAYQMLWKRYQKKQLSIN